MTRSERMQSRECVELLPPSNRQLQTPENSFRPHIRVYTHGLCIPRGTIDCIESSSTRCKRRFPLRTSCQDFVTTTHSHEQYI
ncbi:hypothetical protein BDV98DRAFT_572143 [Pterulicium gracile]|uniref:Uncharacterized protein n=1 Tax=Pterulicium gracile TaxID=1884261 RepID=A0A5C3QC29_9AGAR|nr:hypothetical protein BDV98DRAFT_572143 [Pterula gracilis]